MVKFFMHNFILAKSKLGNFFVNESNICIVSVHFEDHPYLVDFSTKTKTQLPIPDEEGHDQKVLL